MKITKTLEAVLYTFFCHEDNKSFCDCRTSILEVSGFASLKKGNLKYQNHSNSPSVKNLDSQQN